MVDRAACRGGRRVPRRQRRSTGRASTSSASTARPSCTGRRTRLTVQIGDGAALARRDSAFRWSTISAPPTSRRAGRARRWCRSFIARSRAMLERPHPVAVLNLGGVANVTFIDGETGPDRLRHRPGNALIDDFMRARTGAVARRERRRSAAHGQRRRGGGRARARRIRSSREAAEIARPQRLPRNGSAERAALAEQEHRGWRRDADRAHRGDGRCASFRFCRAPPQKLDRRRRRRAQSDPDADARRAACARDASRPRIAAGWSPMRSRRRPSPSGGASLAGIADHVSDHDRRARTDDGRRGRRTVPEQKRK